MAEPVMVEISGLQISNNTFSASPPGSLLVADNIVMPQKGVAEPRRGQDRAYVMPLPQQIPFALTEFRGSLIANYATDKNDEYGLGIAANPTVGFTSFDSTFNPVDRSNDSANYPRMKFGFADTFMHFCTSNGPKVLETLSSQPRAAGLQRMPDCVASMVSSSTYSGTSNWLPYGASVAYRTVLRKPTSDGTSLLSPPSGRAVVTNRIVAPVGSMVRTGGNLVTVTLPGSTNPGLITGDTFTITPGETNFPAAAETVASDSSNVITYNDVGANVSNTVAQDLDTGPRSTILLIALSEDATVDTPVRIYRSLYTSSSAPSDEMFLIDEVFPTSSQVANGFILYEDVTPQLPLTTNDPLYTNPRTGEGLAQANLPPPLYRDIAVWGGRTWYSNTNGLQTFRLQMLGVGSPDGVQNNDTLTIDLPNVGSVTVTFKTTAGPSNEIQITSNGTPSFNIQQTSQDLVLKLNALFNFFDVPIRAYYNSAQDEAPGKILLQRITYEQSVSSDDGAFSVVASRPESWTPALDPVTPVWSDDERTPNGLSYSKLGQAEAVPAPNFTAIGSKNYAIARILGLQQALLVFKEGDGIYSVTGQYPFQVQQISTANIIAPDCCAVFADSAWVYTDQGILRVSDTGGATVVSRPIETKLNELRAVFPEETRDYAFAVPYETERRIMFFVPVDFVVSAGPDQPVLKAYCYNDATQSWSGPLDYGRPFSGVVGVVGNRLALGGYDAPWATGRTTIERKGNGYLDYADADFSNSIVSTNVGGNPLVIRLGSGSDVAAGDGIAQGQWYTKIRRLRPDLGSRYVEVYENIPWTVAACSIYKHYDVRVQFQPFGNPTGRKALTRLSWLFKPEWFASYSGTSILATDQVQADLEISTTFTGFGTTPLGIGPFGDPSPMVVDVNPVDPKWTNAAQFFPGFALSEAWPKFRLQGFSYLIESAAGPAGRGK